MPPERRNPLSDRQDRPCLWTLQETADYLGLPVSTVYQMNSRGTGPRYFRVGRHRRYAPEDVSAWLEERASHEHIAGPSA